MKALFIKEISSFFNSLTGYVAIVVFLLINGLFLWVFPGSYNIMESGQARLDGLFSLAPYVFLFLIPAITMRSISEELRLGTLELLLTKPVSDFRLVMAKYLAGVFLVFMAILPTLVYVISVQVISLPPGLDTGATIGSYIGLLFLGAAFVGVGIFASCFTSSQVQAFLIALLGCGIILLGPELAYGLFSSGTSSLFVRNLGIHAHYLSISRGVIDFRDVVYFLSLPAFFIMLTLLKLASRKWLRNASTTYARRHIGIFATGVLLMLAMNVFASSRYFRVDLTADKRFTLTQTTKNLLRELDDRIHFRVYLEGEMPAAFQRFNRQIREMLDEFRAYSPMISYSMVNPFEAAHDEMVQRRFRELVSKGLEPSQIQVRADDASSTRILFPGALANYGEREVPVNFLQDRMGLGVEEILNASADQLEFVLTSSIRRLVESQRSRIAFLRGHGELPETELSDLTESLSAFYEVGFFHPGDGLDRLMDYDALIVANPVRAFSEQTKFMLDQYLMGGGSMLWFVNPVYASLDSLQMNGETFGLPQDLNLDDMFFRYGLRMNKNLLMDLQAAPLPVFTGNVGREQINLLPWFYFPLLNPASSHSIVKNLNVMRAAYASSLDTTEVEGVIRIPLLNTSRYTRIMPVPVHISLGILSQPPDPSRFNAPSQAVAYLMEGRFPSLFQNRRLPESVLPPSYTFASVSVPTAMIVVADGDFVRSETGPSGQIYPLGFDRYSGETFGNKDFVMNAVHYLAGERGMLEARTREIGMRPLDGPMLARYKTSLQWANLLFPILLVVAWGVIRLLLREYRNKRKQW